MNNDFSRMIFYQATESDLTNELEGIINIEGTNYIPEKSLLDKECEMYKGCNPGAYLLENTLGEYCCIKTIKSIISSLNTKKGYCFIYNEEFDKNYYTVFEKYGLKIPTNTFENWLKEQNIQFNEILNNPNYSNLFDFTIITVDTFDYNTSNWKIINYLSKYIIVLWEDILVTEDLENVDALIENYFIDLKKYFNFNRKNQVSIGIKDRLIPDSEELYDYKSDWFGDELSDDTILRHKNYINKNLTRHRHEPIKYLGIYYDNDQMALFSRIIGDDGFVNHYFGRCITWHKNGKKLSEGDLYGYKDVKSSENLGEVRSVLDYKPINDLISQLEHLMIWGMKAIGTWKVWYANGQIAKQWKSSFEYHPIISINGKTTEWYENGQKLFEGTLKDNWQVSGIHWDEDGTSEIINRK